MMNQSTEAIVLRRTDYGEGDRIVTLLTADLGRISVLAKGVRKPSSKLAGGIEPLAVVKITVRKGRGELYTLTSSQMNTPFTHILADFERLQFAYTVLKKVNQAAETLHEPALYQLLKTTLASLDANLIDARITEAWFYTQFLQLLGQGINVSRTAAGERLSADERYLFATEDMAFVPHPKGEFGANELKVLKLLQLKPPEVIAQIGGVEQVIETCLRLLRRLNDSA